MSDKNSGFLSIAKRLMFATGAESENQLAMKLGLKQSTWSTRKTRDSIPTDAIDQLIEREGLNPEFIYKGTGATHLDSDTESWATGLHKRLAQILSIETYVKALMQNGHALQAINLVAKGKTMPSPELLRDMRRFLNIDLNYLLVGDTSQTLTEPEQRLLKNYRSMASTPQTQEMVEQAAQQLANFSINGLSKLPLQSQSMQGTGVQIGGSVSHSQVLINPESPSHAPKPAKKSSPRRKP